MSPLMWICLIIVIFDVLTNKPNDKVVKRDKNAPENTEIHKDN